MPTPAVSDVPATPAAHWHARPLTDVVAALDTDIDAGLTSAVAAQRLEANGPNELDQAEPEPRWKQFLDQFRNVLVVILLVGAAVSAVIGDFKDSVAIAVVLVANAILGYVQERRAAQSLASLREMLALKVKVRRDGRVGEVISQDLVPGDVVLVEAGDQIPADGRVAGAWSAEVDESSLTGESTPVAKVADAEVDDDAALGDRITAVYMNTQVTQGRLVIVVTDTGMATQLGRVAELIAGADEESTPLQNQLDTLGKKLAVLSGGVVALYFVLGLVRGQEVSDVLISSVALIVAAVPEGLPAVVTLTLAIGTSRLARRGAIVKRLSSVETLGSTSVICSDKTGTLTLNQMTARALLVDGRRFAVSGEGYSPVGSLHEIDEQGDAMSEPAAPDVAAFEAVAVAAALCNDSYVRDGELIGDPTEGAFVVLATKLGIDAEELRSLAPRVGELPFDSAHKFMATFHHDPDDSSLVRCVVKGAVEVVVPRCDEATIAGSIDSVAAQGAVMAADGLRVLALATRTLTEREFDTAQAGGTPAVIELLTGLTLVGVVGLVDPPRPEAIDAVARCHTAGVRVMMITGDHVQTASAIAAQLGIGGEAIEGRVLDDVDDETLPGFLAGVGVVARVSPEHKVRVVQALRSAGGIVAMTGDGVNDAPALSAADIGVAMGITGTEVAKDSADMVLTDDNFATIAGAVEQGRGIYANIVKFVRFQVATNIGALSTFVVAQLAALPVPFNPIQILWINLIMDGPPAMALGIDPATPGAMEQPPRDPKAQILTRSRLIRVFLAGSLMAIGTLGVLVVVRDAAGEAQALTAAFTTFVLFQVANALNVRSENHTVFARSTLSNPQLWAALVGVFVLQMLVVYLPFGQRLFSTSALTATEWALALAVASTIVWAEEIYKFVRRRAARTPGDETALIKSVEQG